MKVSMPRFDQAAVLVVGDVMLDRYWHGGTSRISPEAPVPVVKVEQIEDRPGGAANVALNIAALGAPAVLVGVTGADEAAGSLRDSLAAAGVQAHFQQIAAQPTIVKLRVLSRHQQLLRMDFENTPKTEILASQTASFMDLLPRHDAVLFSDYGKGGLAHVSDMIARAKTAGKPILIDPKGSDYSRYQGATVITPNRAELQQVVGHWQDEADLQTKAHTLREQLGLQAILVTRSEEGMTLFDAAGQVSVSAQAREVFDVTGAGDTVIATMAALVAAGLTLREALPLANRAGGLVVGKFGTATVSYQELFA